MSTNSGPVVYAINQPRLSSRPMSTWLSLRTSLMLE